VKTSSNRNILYAIVAAVIIAAVTAAVLAASTCGSDDDDESGIGGAVSVARRLMTPVPVDASATDKVKNDVVASIASKGTGRVIVEVATNLSPNASAQDEVRAIASSQDNVLSGAQGSVNVVDRLSRLPILVLEVDEAGARSLANSSSVVSMMEDKLARAQVTETIPMIGAPAVYAAGFTGAGFSVAILDSGVEAAHSFYGGRVVGEACFSRTIPSQRSTTLCPNGQSEQVGPGSSNGCPIGLDGCDHGSHVAGIAAGNASGGSGVARGAGIVGVQVFSRFSGQETCGSGGDCILAFDSDQIRGLEWVLANRDTYNIASVNMSIGGGRYTDQATCDAENQPFKAVVDRLVAANIAVVMSAGNEAYTDAIGANGCVSSAIAVGSVTKSNQISDFSNSHEMLDIFAPGSSIVSSVKGNRFDLMGGTSMASPHVAGAFALLRSAKPSATVSEIFAALTQGGQSFQDPRNGLVRPRLQVDTALEILNGAAPQPTPAPQPSPAPTGAPVHDDQNNPIAITTPSFQHVVDTRNASMSDDAPIYPTWYCPDGGRYDKSVWYSFTAPSNGYLTVTTAGSNYDTIVSVWQGSRGGQFQIGCNDDDAYPGNLTTTIAGWVAAGTTFRFNVAAWDNGGTLVFSAAFQGSNVSSTVTDPNLAPVVFDSLLTEAPSDLATSRPANTAAIPAGCGAKGQRPEALKGECYNGPALR